MKREPRLMRYQHDWAHFRQPSTNRSKRRELNEAEAAAERVNTSVSVGLCRFQKSGRAGVDFIGAHRLQGSVVIDHVQGVGRGVVSEDPRRELAYCRLQRGERN